MWNNTVLISQLFPVPWLSQGFHRKHKHTHTLWLFIRIATNKPTHSGVFPAVWRNFLPECSFALPCIGPHAVYQRPPQLSLPPETQANPATETIMELTLSPVVDFISQVSNLLYILYKGSKGCSAVSCRGNARAQGHTLEICILAFIKQRQEMHGWARGEHMQKRHKPESNPVSVLGPQPVW